jgi:superfamily II DNA or RNA helicase
MLKELSLKTVYDSSKYNLVQDIQVPLLAESLIYYRGVGYFSSGWLKFAAKGILQLAQRNGKVNFIISPILSENDKEALILGEKAKQDLAIKNLIKQQIYDLSQSLEKDFQNALAWLVADEVLNFKFAIPRINPNTRYHDKIGVFIDSNSDYVVIHGSINDSIQGTLNGEAFSLFKSWDTSQAQYANPHYKRLISLWNNKNSQFKTLDFETSLKQKFIELRNSERPYSNNLFFKKKQPYCPIKTREYQEEAINLWFENGNRGIFEMATGTGKTYTALAGATKLLKVESPLMIVITVPFAHLATQWINECKTFNFPTILCSSNNRNWKIEMKSSIANLNLKVRQSICFVAVNDTGSSDDFLEIAARAKVKTLFIADEAHSLGSKQFKKALCGNYEFRLGLTATPKRWHDPLGTEEIFDYFDGVCFSFPLKNAIGPFLVPYNYYTIIVNLTEEEKTDYLNLSQKIGILLGRISKINQVDLKENKDLQSYLISRANIVKNAEKKRNLFVETIKKIKESEPSNKLPPSIVYTSPDSFLDVKKALSKIGIKCHGFNYKIPIAQRQKIIDDFTSGKLEAIVAIKCLDEGIDIPCIQKAFILASSTNPKEFIQRRGRILRKYKNKKSADIYDFISLPEKTDELNFAISLLRREMPRYQEYSNLSQNKHREKGKIFILLNTLGLTNFLYKNPEENIEWKEVESEE